MYESRRIVYEILNKMTFFMDTSNHHGPYYCNCFWNIWIFCVVYNIYALSAISFILHISRHVSISKKTQPTQHHPTSPSVPICRRCRTSDVVSQKRPVWTQKVLTNVLRRLGSAGRVLGRDTPWKINMEPTNHPFRKENDLPGLHDYVPY